MAESADKGTKKARDRTGWQAQKSAMTRDTILDAALDCFISIVFQMHRRIY